MNSRPPLRVHHTRPPSSDESGVRPAPISPANDSGPRPATLDLIKRADETPVPLLYGGADVEYLERRFAERIVLLTRIAEAIEDDHQFTDSDDGLIRGLNMANAIMRPEVGSLITGEVRDDWGFLPGDLERGRSAMRAARRRADERVAAACDRLEERLRWERGVPA